MQFISEEIIDKKAALIGAEGGHQEAVQQFKAKQPALLVYLFSDSFELLTQKEREYMMYLVLVIWASINEVEPDIPQVVPKMVEEKEEFNWEKLKLVKAKYFRDRLDVFFDGYPQEDLLAFAEDALVHDEDNMVSKEGREYLFIALKTIIDCLHERI